MPRLAHMDVNDVMYDFLRHESERIGITVPSLQRMYIAERREFKAYVKELAREHAHQEYEATRQRIQQEREATRQRVVQQRAKPHFTTDPLYIEAIDKLEASITTTNDSEAAMEQVENVRRVYLRGRLLKGEAKDKINYLCYSCEGRIVAERFGDGWTYAKLFAGYRVRQDT